jgi:hypothetical protein
MEGSSRAAAKGNGSYSGTSKSCVISSSASLDALVNIEVAALRREVFGVRRESLCVCVRVALPYPKRGVWLEMQGSVGVCVRVRERET